MINFYALKFAYCDSLREIIIHDSITTFGKGVFNGILKITAKKGKFCTLEFFTQIDINIH